MSLTKRGLSRGVPWRSLGSHWPELTSALLGVAWIAWHGGTRIVDPRDPRWLMCGDWAWHHLGWLFYQRDGWRLPLGAIGDYPDPIGTTTVFTDSVPWLALTLKALPLPLGFQYLGPWLVSCFALIGFWAARLVRLFTANGSAIVLGAIPFVVTPILLLRTGHAALSAHWLLLWSLHLYLRPLHSVREARQTWTSALLLSALAPGIHAYLMAMTLPVVLALWWRLWRVDGLFDARSAKLALGQCLATTLVVMLLLGHFDGTGPAGGGYGTYVADLLTFVDSMGWSRIVPPLATQPGEVEGFGYLGLGVLGLLPFVAIAAWRSKTQVAWRRLGPLIVVVVALFVHALSVRVTVGGHTLIDTNFTFFTVAKVFQSTGRFIWPSYYLLIVAAVGGTLSLTRARPWLGPVLLGVAACIQVGEQGTKTTRFGHDGIPIVVPRSPRWQAAVGNYQAIKLFPPEGTKAYAMEPPKHGAVALGYLAYEHGWTVDSAVLARSRSRKAYVARVEADVERGDLARNALYVVWDHALEHVARVAHCGKIDGYNVCVSRRNHDEFARELR